MNVYKKKVLILAADKNYLYKQILKSLQYFHTEARTSLQIKNQIAYIEILYQKGLYNQCSKIIKHCKKQAQEAELPSLLIEILHWQRKIEGNSASWACFLQTR